MKIRIIDDRQRFDGWQVLGKENEIDLVTNLTFCDDRQSLEEELSSTPPDALLCHANDLITKGVFDGDLLRQYTRKGIHVLLFSGAGVEVTTLTPDSVEVQTSEMASDAPVLIQECNSKLIRGCKKHIFSAADFPVEQAISAALESKKSSDGDPAIAFIDALTGHIPVLEQKLCLLYATLIPEDLKQYAESEEYQLLRRGVTDETRVTVDSNVGQLLKGSGERVALIRELRDALLASD